MDECSSSCQLFCQGCEGTGCMTCQSTCQGLCQDCEGAGCQTSCEGTCEWACEGACETASQSVDHYEWQFNPVEVVSNETDTAVRALWSGHVGGEEVLCAACNGYLWQLTLGEDGKWSKTSCGALDTESEVCMFGFDGKLYLLNGSEYKVWDGSSLENVGGYRPMVAVAAPPSGGGTALEQINKLTAARRMRFSPDGAAKSFTLPERGITSVDYVKDVATGASLGGWEADTAAGKVIFSAAPAEGTDSLEIGWTASGSSAGEVRAMRFAELYNGAQDTRVFIYGDGSCRALYSGLDFDGQPRADYFPELNVAHVGEANSPLTAMIRHYDTLLAFKSDSAWSISYRAITLADGGVTAGFCITPVNRSLGCCAPGQAVLVENRPRTPDARSILEWRSLGAYGGADGGERNAERVSQRVERTIGGMALERARTFYDKFAHEYYVIGEDGTALVQNVEADAWYVYTNLDARCLINYKDELYFGTGGGELRHLSDGYLDDCGEAIDALWESGAMGFDEDFRRKYSSMLWIGVKSEDNGRLAVTAETDRGVELAEYVCRSPESGSLPETERVKLRSGRFNYYKLILSCPWAGATATVVSVELRVRGSGYVR